MLCARDEENNHLLGLIQSLNSALGTRLVFIDAVRQKIGSIQFHIKYWQARTSNILKMI